MRYLLLSLFFMLLMGCSGGEQQRFFGIELGANFNTEGYEKFDNKRYKRAIDNEFLDYIIVDVENGKAVSLFAVKDVSDTEDVMIYGQPLYNKLNSKFGSPQCKAITLSSMGKVGEECRYIQGNYEIKLHVSNMPLVHQLNVRVEPKQTHKDEI